MSLEIRHFVDESSLCKTAATEFIAYIDQVLKTKTNCDIALAGGNTAKLFFKAIKPLKPKQEILERLRFFFSDERVLPLSNQESNAGNAWRLLLDPWGVKKESFFPMCVDDLLDASISAKNYEKLLYEKLSANTHGLPQFDLIYLGIGRDGHTASIFPYSDLSTRLINQEQLIVAKSHTAQGTRITLCPSIINAAKKVIFMATDQEKLPIINEITQGPLDLIRLPAQFIIRFRKQNTEILISKYY